MKPLLPMLATAAAPFDSEAYLFEVKWDGVRALAVSEAGRWRLWGRMGTDYTARYPELAVLGRLPSGTVVDGELVVLQDGRADFPALLRRHQRQHRHPFRATLFPPQLPVTYVLFDLLFERGRCLLQEALVQRRARLRELLAALDEPVLAYSAGVVGGGREFFARVVAQGQEGVVAKHQASRYRPGQRSAAWRKIKPVGMLPCVIVGYRPGREGIPRLLLAAVQEGQLHYVGQVRPRGAPPAGVALRQRLAAQRRQQPLVRCPLQACWVEPVLYCRVKHQGWTARGQLRAAVFCGLMEETA
jgi:bifunctional non-homologous end joining protein LigD